jgi:hypothetical protein
MHISTTYLFAVMAVTEAMLETNIGFRTCIGGTAIHDWGRTLEKETVTKERISLVVYLSDMMRESLMGSVHDDRGDAQSISDYWEGC